MNIIRTLLLLIVSFSAISGEMTLIGKRDLLFMDAIGGYNQVITIPPSHHSAAVVEISSGIPNAWITLKIVESTKVLVGTKDSNDEIKVNRLIFGGSVNSDGTARLNSSGDLKNIRIGGTVAVSAKNKDKNYVFSPTIVVNYL